MAWLQSINGPKNGRKFAIPKGRTVLGRELNCDLVLDDDAVSRRHALIEWGDDEDDYYIEDLKSRNRTFVNGQQVVGRRKLRDNDQVKICDLLFSFHCEPGSSAILVDDAESESGSTIMSKLDVKSSHSGLRATAVNPETKLKALLEISRNVGSTLEQGEVLSKILDSLFKIFVQADRGFVILRQGHEGPLAIKADKYRRQGVAAAARISRTIVHEAMQSGQAILSQDKFDEIQSVADMNIRSIMCVPLVGTAGRALGVIQIDTRDHRTRFQTEDLEVLASVANLAAVAVENTRLHETEIAKLALDHDLLIARNVQKRFLPCQLPRCEGYEFYHFYEAARQIGGDFFDYIALPDRRLAVVVADVSGKGIPAALMMAKMSAETRYVLVSERDPAAALNRLNAEFCEAGWEDRFVTMAVVVIDLLRHEVQIVNAGHMPPFLRTAAGDVVLLGEQEAGLPLGVSTEFGYRSIAVPLAPGDCLTMFTDGINEAMDPHGAQYGVERLAGQLRRGNLSARQLGERILDDVKEFAGASAQFDDMCLLCFGRE